MHLCTVVYCITVGHRVSWVSPRRAESKSCRSVLCGVASVRWVLPSMTMSIVR